MKLLSGKKKKGVWIKFYRSSSCQVVTETDALGNEMIKYFSIKGVK
jgi:hypothetical protein